MKSSLVLLILFSLGYCALHRKHLAGPPSEFSSHSIPSPANAALEERSAHFDVRLTRNSAGAGTTMELVVDSDSLFSFQIFSPIEDKLKLSLKDPQGNEIDLSSHTHRGELSYFPIGLEHIEGTNYFFQSPFPKGVWSLTFTVEEALAPRLDSEPDALLVLYNESPIKAHTYLNTYSLHLGGQIGLVTRLTDDEDGKIRPRALREVITKAVMEVYDPSGNEVDVQMHDDGLHFDEGANDGIFGGVISATQTGIYRAEAYIEGTTSDGSLVRSTQHLLPIVVESLTLTGTAKVVPKDNERIEILVDVTSDHAADKIFRAYTEVWGKDSQGNDVAVCWLSGLVNVEQVKADSVLTLELNVNWLKIAGAQAPLTLKNVIIQDADVYVPVAEAASIPVQETRRGVIPKVTAPMAIEITKEMTQGVFPKELKKNSTKSGSAPSLLLLHGYCSDVNPWKKYEEDFTDASYFIEPSASLTNEEFSKLVLQHTDELGMTQFSGIGHSQGGIVLAHILNYYFSGLDLASGGRRIQSVGSPYQGNSGAGCAAKLINLFGFGCGENFDLTTDGSQLWLVGLSPETRKEIYYYTTTYEQGTWFGDHCNLATNLVLKWPNDGTTELAYSVLEGANSQGNIEQWCHTTDMNYPAQYYDRERNAVMDSLAAR